MQESARELWIPGILFLGLGTLLLFVYEKVRLKVEVLPFSVALILVLVAGAVMFGLVFSVTSQNSPRDLTVYEKWSERKLPTLTPNMKKPATHSRMSAIENGEISINILTSSKMKKTRTPRTKKMMPGTISKFFLISFQPHNCSHTTEK